MVKTFLILLYTSLLQSCVVYTNLYGEIISDAEIKKNDVSRISTDGYYYSIDRKGFENKEYIHTIVFLNNGLVHKSFSMLYEDFLRAERECIDSYIKKRDTGYFKRNTNSKYLIFKDELITQSIYKSLWYGFDNSFVRTSIYKIVNKNKLILTSFYGMDAFKDQNEVYTFRKFSNENNLKKLSQYLDDDTKGYE